jgi:hypothetical protein
MHNMLSDLDIIRILAESCDDLDQAKMIARSAGLRIERIPFLPTASIEVHWSNIWREAQRDSKQLELIDEMRKRYQHNATIRQIYEQINLQRKQSQSSNDTGTWIIPRQKQINKAEQQNRRESLDEPLTLFYSYAHNDEALRKNSRIILARFVIKVL